MNGQVNGTRKISEDELAVLNVRSLVLDLCQQHGGGHGGSALGMAAIGVALWKYVMRYNPADPDWLDRDRFVLSNGKWDSLYKKQSNADWICRTRQHLPLHHAPSRWVRRLDDGGTQRVCRAKAVRSQYQSARSSGDFRARHRSDNGTAGAGNRKRRRLGDGVKESRRNGQSWRVEAHTVDYLVYDW